MTEPPISRSVLIVEDEWATAEHIRGVLEEHQVEVLDWISRPDKAQGSAAAQKPSLVLLDLSIAEARDGIGLGKTLREMGLEVVVVSGHGDAETIRRVMEFHPAGYVVKPFTDAQLMAAVEVGFAAADREKRATKAVDDIVRVLGEAGFGDVVGRGPELAPEVPGLDILSDREREVLDALLAHKRPPQIAKELFISPHTVRNHLKSIYAKLGVHSQVELLDLLLGRD